MKYFDGQDVQLGDRVDLGSEEGLVVAVISDGLFSDDYPAEKWSTLENGLLLLTEEMVLHYPETDDPYDLRMVLIERAAGGQGYTEAT